MPVTFEGGIEKERQRVVAAKAMGAYGWLLGPLYVDLGDEPHRFRLPEGELLANFSDGELQNGRRCLMDTAGHLAAHQLHDPADAQRVQCAERLQVVLHNVARIEAILIGRGCQLAAHEPLVDIRADAQLYEFISGPDQIVKSLALGRLHALTFDVALHIRPTTHGGPNPGQSLGLLAECSARGALGGEGDLRCAVTLRDDRGVEDLGLRSSLTTVGVETWDSAWNAARELMLRKQYKCVIRELKSLRLFGHRLQGQASQWWDAAAAGTADHGNCTAIRSLPAKPGVMVGTAVSSHHEGRTGRVVISSGGGIALLCDEVALTPEPAGAFHRSLSTGPSYSWEAVYHTFPGALNASNTA